MKQEPAITVWKDGTWKVWGSMDAQYAETDSNYLLTIPISTVLRDIKNNPEIDINEVWAETAA